MEKIIVIVMKIISWLRVNLTAILGILQSAIKIIKEIITLIVDLLSLFMPLATAQSIVAKVRTVLNTIDVWIENIKSKLLDF